MARLPNDVVVVSEPVRTFPNGDYFFMELSRKNSRYECLARMTSSSNPGNPVVMARGLGKTIREAEENCYLKVIERCPRFPKPPYFKRGETTRRVVPNFRTAAPRDIEPTDTLIPEPVR